MTALRDAKERSRRLARYYDLDLADIWYDAELYQELAHETGGPVFELAVGSGRLAIPLALAGHTVVGVDNEPAMLERARATWDRRRGELDPGRLQLHHDDLRSFRPAGRFGLTFIAVNTFLLAKDDDARLAILIGMLRSLRSDGIAVVEISTPDAEELAGYDGQRRHEWVRRDPDTGDEVSKSITATHDATSGIVRLTQRFDCIAAVDGARSHVTNVDTLHLVSAEHLGELASRAGFESISLRGDHLTMPYGARSHRAILVARLL